MKYSVKYIIPLKDYEIILKDLSPSLEVAYLTLNDILQELNEKERETICSLNINFTQ